MQRTNAVIEIRFASKSSRSPSQFLGIATADFTFAFTFDLTIAFTFAEGLSSFRRDPLHRLL
jgi:hypothetical protein